MSEKILSFFHWTYYHDGTMETNCTPDLKTIRIKAEPIDETLVPIEKPPPKVTQSAQTQPNLSKPPVNQLTCKRCNVSWTPRKKKPPVQCPKCKSPYWNRARKKK